MYLCPKDTNFYAHFDELLLLCVDQTTGPFTNTVWIDTRVIEKWKRIENQAYNLRPMVQFWWFLFSALYEKGLSTVFTWSGTFIAKTAQ